MQVDKLAKKESFEVIDFSTCYHGNKKRSSHENPQTLKCFSHEFQS